MHTKVAASRFLMQLVVWVIFADSVHNADLGPSPLKNTKDTARQRQWHVASLVNNVENVIFILIFFLLVQR